MKRLISNIPVLILVSILYHIPITIYSQSQIYPYRTYSVEKFPSKVIFQWQSYSILSNTSLQFDAKYLAIIPSSYWQAHTITMELLNKYFVPERSVLLEGDAVLALQPVYNQHSQRSIIIALRRDNKNVVLELDSNLQELNAFEISNPFKSISFTCSPKQDYTAEIIATDSLLVSVPFYNTDFSQVKSILQKIQVRSQEQKLISFVQLESESKLLQLLIQKQGRYYSAFMRSKDVLREILPELNDSAYVQSFSSFADVQYVIIDKTFSGASVWVGAQNSLFSPSKLSLVGATSGQFLVHEIGVLSPKNVVVDIFTPNYSLERRKLLDYSSVQKSEKCDEIGEFRQLVSLGRCVAIIGTKGIVLYHNETLMKLAFLPGEIVPPNKIELLDYQDNAEIKCVITYGNYTIHWVSRFDSFWRIKDIWKNGYRVFVAVIAFLGLIILFLRYRSARRLVHVLFGSENSDFWISLDSSGRLKQISAGARELLNIPEGIRLGKLFRTYCVTEDTIKLIEMIDKSYVMSETVKEIITMYVGDKQRKMQVTVVPYRALFGRKAFLVLGRDLTVSLEQERLTHWAQLAHDMQTNLSVIKLTAESIAQTGSEEQAHRAKKIVHQAQLMLGRVRDLVIIGRDWNKLRYEPVLIQQLFDSIALEFDNGYFTNASIHVEKTSIILSCDKSRLERALRNAAENGLKSLRGEQGTITLSAKQSGSFVHIYVRDTGAGMDSQTVSKLNVPYFTTAESKGGSGMGMMIIRHIITMHGGTIEVQSEPGKGTCLEFVLPVR